MRGFSGKLCHVVCVLALLTAVGACAKKTVPSQSGYGTGGVPGGGYEGGTGTGLGMDDARWRELGITSEAEKREFLDKAGQFENQDVFYDYDSYALSEPAKKILEVKAQFLRRWPKVRVTVEGHCDDRGTNEYNLALGERRANSALQYLVNMGIGSQNISMVSYGEERPLATGSDESSWAKNRRAHFVLNY